MADRSLPPSFRRFWASAAAANAADAIRAGALPLIAAAVSEDACPVALIAACQQGAWLVFGRGAGRRPAAARPRGGAPLLPAVAVAASGTTAVTAAMLALSSGGFALWNVVALSTRQREAPRELRGRVRVRTGSPSSAAARWAPSPAACSPTPSA
ncbi:hypothetical protein [Streptomyces albidoflavus]|uniref:hypothetical protein n=1 Tax=Streptomyces albidoflavus TaxID=1886 RepID=UPI0033CFE9B3|nr:hypothetical protein OG794_25355 [Streptomyces albidoflavus]